MLLFCNFTISDVSEDRKMGVTVKRMMEDHYSFKPVSEKEDTTAMEEVSVR